MFAASKSGSVAEATDAQFNYVTMLLHGDGTNGAQNNTFLDSSTNNFTITRNGNTTQGTFTPYGANWSTSFNGSSDYLTTPQTTSLNIGTGTFTVEAFVYLNSKYSSGGTSIINLGNGANGGGPYTGWGLIIDYDAGSSTAYPAWYRYDGSVTQYTSSTSLNVGQWYHLAVARDSSNNIAIWVNGTRVFSGTSTVTYNNVNSDPLNIGRRTNGSANSPNWMNGYISNGRVVIGSNVYDPTQSTITVPTTPLTAVTNTQLLVLQSNRFVDNSSAARAITVAGGSPSVQRFSPFSPTTAYSTSVIGGSGYFDGSGDYLTAPQGSAFQFSGDFTIECFVYSLTATGGSNYSGVFDTRSGNVVSSASANINFKPDGYLNIYVGGTNAASSTLLGANQWVHVAMVRSGSTVTLYQNGVSVATVTTSANLTDGYCTIGGFISDGYWNGYISNTRVVKGTAVYTSAFTPPTAPLTAVTNTSLLLNNTNAGILDNAMMNDLETVGNAQISTSVKKYGTGSLAFDGTGDLLTIPNNTSWQSSVANSQGFNFGTGDFTVECWVYFNATTSFITIVGSRNYSNGGSSTYGNWVLRAGTSNLYTSYSNSSTSKTISGTYSWSTGVWYHVAWVRYNGTVSVYRDGTSIGSVADSTSLTDGQYGITVGGNFDTAGTQGTIYNPLDGYIDDLRITKGYARYTASFTAPTTAFADKG